MVKYMKKIIIIFSIVFLIFIININHKNEKVEEVSLNEKTVFNIDEYNVFKLNLEEENITTLNLGNIITKDMNIISIIPYVNPLYIDKIDPIKYKYENMSLKKNMAKLTNYYIDYIKDKGIVDDLNYIKVDGLKIIELEVYARGSDIVNMAYNYRKIKYKNLLTNDYQYFPF